MNIIGPFANNLENRLFLEHVVIGQSSPLCPGLIVRTVNFVTQPLTIRSHESQYNHLLVIILNNQLDLESILPQ